MASRNYKKRIFQLKDTYASYGEIKRIIHEEYGILLKSSHIDYVLNEISDNESIVNSNIDKSVKLIEKIIRKSKLPISTRDISKILRYEHQERMTKSQINKVIHRHLKDKVSYDRYYFTYSWRGISSAKNSLNHVKNKIESILGDLDSLDIFDSIKRFFKNYLFQTSTGIEKIDYLIKSVVKDNRITVCEETFLKLKAREFGYSEDIITEAEKNLAKNNPYLDNLIHIIFDDGIITREEIQFLREKGEEHNFSFSFVNERFWLIGGAKFLPHLLKVKPIDEVLILFYVMQKCDSEKYTLSSLLESLDIFNGDNNYIDTLGLKVREKLRSDLNKKLSALFKYQFDYSRYLMESLNKKDNLNVTNDSELTLKSRVMKILIQEKHRIGSPDVNLLVENINYRIENNLWD